MSAAPKAMSHGLGGGGATTGAAFTAMSAANAGALPSARTARSDQTTFFIAALPLFFDRHRADPNCPSFAYRPRQRATRYATRRALAAIYSFGAVPRQGEKVGSCCLFRQRSALLT